MYNLELASDRAIEVFEHLTFNGRIDPIKNLLSVSSYGEFKPVARNLEDTLFSEIKMQEANSSIGMMNRNRRIEIVLNYRGDFIASN